MQPCKENRYNDPDYKPPSNNKEETDNKIKYKSEKDYPEKDYTAEDPEKEDDYIEVAKVGGAYTKIRNAQIPDSAAIKEVVQQDKRFKQNALCGSLGLL